MFCHLSLTKFSLYVIFQVIATSCRVWCSMPKPPNGSNRTSPHSTTKRTKGMCFLSLTLRASHSFVLHKCLANVCMCSLMRFCTISLQLNDCRAILIRIDRCRYTKLTVSLSHINQFVYYVQPSPYAFNTRSTWIWSHHN